MKRLCWSRGALSTVGSIHLLSMLLLVATLLMAPPVSRCLPVRDVAVAAVDKELIVELNGAVSFNCTASSNDQQLCWYDGSLLVNSAQDHHGVIVMETDSNTVTINIANVTPYHYGNYKCIDIVSEEVVKTVGVMPSSSPNGSTHSQLITEKLIEQRDDDIVVSCDKGERLVKVDEEFDHYDITDNNLVVTSSQHQGKYLCLGVGKYPTMICYVQLSGYYPLAMTINPVNTKQVPPYQDLDCLVTGGPGPIHINWYYNNIHGRPIADGGRIHVAKISNGSGYEGGLRLVLKSAFPHYDSGIYICVAKTDWEVTKQSLHINLTIDGSIGVSYIAYWPPTIPAAASSDIRISCYAVSLDTSLSIELTLRRNNVTLLSHMDMLNEYVTSTSLVLHNVTELDAGEYSCLLWDIVHSEVKPASLIVYEDPLHIISFTLNQSSTGHTILICNVTIHEDFIGRLGDVAVVIEQQHNSSITPVVTFAANNISISTVVRENGLYKCIATIDGISKSRRIIIGTSNTNKSTSNLVKNILLVGLGVVGLLCVIMCTLLFIICCQCPQKPANSSYSNMVSKTKIGARLSANSCASADFVFHRSSSKDNLLSSSEWTVPYDALQFDCSLGSGAFGTVRKAYLMTGVGCKTPVAVKSLQCGDGGVSTKEAFEKEVMILHRVGPHQNIIGLFGVCMQPNKYLLIMELASKGNLLDYLHQKRTDKLQPLSVHEVLNFAMQIASGMEHLVKQQCVHCDLAARNVLITEDFTLKISDFGLARSLYSGVYVKDRSKKVRLPVRWMAPESMMELKFTSQSDIWSYTVVIWEIYQLGAIPYHAISTHKLCQLLQQGLRLEKPQNCSPRHYQLMLLCWHGNPNWRPSFTEISQELSHLLTTTSVVYINWNDDDDYYSDCSTECSNISASSAVEDFCPVHGTLSATDVRSHPTVKRNVLPLKRKDSGLPDSPNDPFSCKNDLQCNKTNYLLEETDI